MKPARARVLAWSAGIVASASIAVAFAVRSSHEGAPPAPSPASGALGGLSAAASAVIAVSAPPAVMEQQAPAEPTSARCAPEPTLEAPAVDLPSTEEILRRVREEPRAFGSASMGSSTRGSLWGGVEIQDSEGIQHAGGYGWGTEMVVRSIERAVREVRRCYPGTPRLHVGDIARERGGWLRPHRSHQSGLDADIGYYYRTDATWYLRATAQNLDVARTWALVRAFIEGGNVEMIFMDISVQRILRAHLETLPESERPPDNLFASPLKRDAIIRHTWGHATHFHVRFTDAAAVKLGLRLKGELPRLLAPKRPTPPAPAPRRVGPPARR